MHVFRHRFRDGSESEITAELEDSGSPRFCGSGIDQPSDPDRYIEWVMWRAHVNTILINLFISRKTCKK